MKNNFRQLFKNILPGFIIDLYKEQRRKRNQRYRDHLSRVGKVLSEGGISEELKKAGLKNGDVVMIHSSLSSLGNVDNGAVSVINAFKDVVGSEGTICMPSFPAIGYNYDYLSSKPVFDIKNTESKMGKITEEFRKQEGVERSFHPTDSVCAWGKHAVYLTKDHFDQLTPYNLNSPFYKLILLKAKIILIGVKLETVTNFHTPEDEIPDFKYPVYHSRLFTVKMIDEHGKERTMQTKVHDPVFSKKRRCNDLYTPFKNAGFLKEFKLGETNCMIIDAESMHNWLIDNYKKGITIYTPFGEKIH